MVDLSRHAQEGQAGLVEARASPAKQVVVLAHQQVDHRRVQLEIEQAHADGRSGEDCLLRGIRRLNAEEVHLDLTAGLD